MWFSELVCLPAYLLWTEISWLAGWTKIYVSTLPRMAYVFIIRIRIKTRLIMVYLKKKNNSIWYPPNKYENYPDFNSKTVDNHTDISDVFQIIRNYCNLSSVRRALRLGNKGFGRIFGLNSCSESFKIFKIFSKYYQVKNFVVYFSREH